MKKKLSGSQIKRLIIVLMILGLAIITLILIGGPLVFWSLLAWLVNKMVLGSGMNVWLARGLMVPVAALLFYAIGLAFSLKKKKRVTGAILLCVFLCLGSLAMYNFTKEQHFAPKTNEPAQWYSKTPDGYRLFPRPGYDPVTGEKLQKVTPEVAKEIEILKTTKGKIIKPVQEEYQFFDFWGRPIRWYYKDMKGKIEIFDRPGSHPTYGEPLLPVTKEIVQQYLKQLKREKTMEPEERILYDQLPNEFNFCGEHTIINDDKKCIFAKALRFQIDFHSSRKVRYIKNNPWFFFIGKQLQQAGLPVDLKYITVEETSLIPRLWEGGYWGFTDDIAPLHGLRVKTDYPYVFEQFDPVKSTSAITEVFKKHYMQFKNWSSVIVAYKMNPDDLKDAMKRAGTDDFYKLNNIPEEIQRIPFNVLAVKLIFENPGEYGISREGWIDDKIYNNCEIIKTEIKITEEFGVSCKEFIERLHINYPNLTIKDLVTFNPHLFINDYTEPEIDEILDDRFPRGTYTVYIIKRNGTS